MRAEVAVAIAALAACDRVFGLDNHGPSIDAPAHDAPGIDAFACATPLGADLDGDGLDDGCDPCIAPASDATSDLDSDHIANGSDPCPFDPTTGSADSDGDGIPDSCDPFPLTKDTRRCFMAFTNPNVSANLWAPVAGHAWAVSPGALAVTGAGTTPFASEVTESIEAPGASTSYTAQFVITAIDNGPAHVALLARTGSDDVRGCAVEMQDNGQVTLAYRTGSGDAIGSAATLKAFGPSLGVRITVEIVPGGAADSTNCQAIIAGSNDVTGLVTQGTDPDLPGVFGLEADRWNFVLDGIEVLQE